ncbi:MAG TPA: DUF222 domain-containing protein [Candidatus Deferrimicrobium sp.]|nr:DUF222 domain-containing protein [Candidatus Deferrimicrobium sp.]
MLATAASSSVADPVEALAHAVDAVAVQSIADMSDHALGDDLVAIRRQIDRLEAQFLRRLRPFDSHQGALSEGAASTVSWLRATQGLTGAAAAQRVRMARFLEDLPQTTASFEAGRAPFTNVSLIARLADDVGAEATRGVEDTLVPAAEALDVARMYDLVAFTRYRIDSDGVLEQDNRAYDRRWFSCDQTYGGVFILRGELDAEGGAMLKSAIDALSVPSGPEDDRIGSQRRADALVELASRQLKSGKLPSVHGQRPHLTLTASLETLRREPGAPPAELGGAGPIHAETARRIACDSICTEVTLADNAVPLSVGRAKRSIPAPIRTALGLRDKGCRFPGCDRPPDWTDGHHIKHWVDGGETSLENLVLLCQRHHHMLHERGWRLRLDPEGVVTVEEPRDRPGLVRRL